MIIRKFVCIIEYKGYVV